MEAKNWIAFKKDMTIKEPDRCTSINEDFATGTLTITYSDDYDDDGKMRRSRVIIKFAGESVFAYRKRNIINSNTVTANVDTTDCWIFSTKESEFVDSYKEFLYEESFDSTTHYIFISESDVVDVISGYPPKEIEEFVGEKYKR